MRILIFGDSIAYGEYDSKGGWANRLYLEYLNHQADNLAGDNPFIFNLSIDGDTTRGVVNRLAQETDARRWPGEEFAFVFAIGINDSRRSNDAGEHVSTPEKYDEDLRKLYDRASKYSKKVLFVGLTPVEDDHFAGGKYETARIWQFEQTLRAFVKEKGASHVPLFEMLKERIDKGEQLYSDGLHPNDEGHQLMYGQIKPKLRNLFA